MDYYLATHTFHSDEKREQYMKKIKVRKMMYGLVS